MVEPLRHRQPKGAATDMFNLQPPRHISTLPDPDDLECLLFRRLRGKSGHFSDRPKSTLLTAADVGDLFVL